MVTKKNNHKKHLSEIHIKGARSNNLKDIELIIPKNKLVVVTGLSGSGKSSLVMDTLFAEGQRRYVESLSSYARQFLSRIKKPDVDFIKGIAPAIAIKQKTVGGNNRSTVGSMTEIYDYLRLLYARIGKTISPISGKEVKKHAVSDVINYIQKLDNGSKIQLFTPINIDHEKRTIAQELNLLMQKGYSRVRYQKGLHYIEELLENKALKSKRKIASLKQNELLILIDRFVINDNIENEKRIADSIQLCFSESLGDCIILHEDGTIKNFNNRFELDDIVFLEPNHHLFNYNNPYGACPICEGFGKTVGISPEKVIPNKGLSIFENAVACWKGEKLSTHKEDLIRSASIFNFPIHRPINELSEQEYQLLWDGNEYFWGIHKLFTTLAAKAYKIQNRVLLARYRGRTICPECNGGRLRKESSYVKIGDKNIMDLVDMPINELHSFFKNLKLTSFQKEIAKRIIHEINLRLDIMMELGLSYLTINRVSNTLSGGETQRINLIRTLGSNLTNSLYILDEPSIGLHPRDTTKLIKVLRKLRDLENTVIVVEHEEEIISSADEIIELGPLAGINGGELIFNGSYEKFKKGVKNSLTSDYMSKKLEIPIPNRRMNPINWLYLTNISTHNLKNIDVKIPINAMTVVSGVSGSGKTSLIKHSLYPKLKNSLELHDKKPVDQLTGDIDALTAVEMIDQRPIGKSSRSNPVTYVKAFDAIRNLFANQQLSKRRGYKTKHFSFNVEGGRCETCKGEGEITVEMQFLADVKLVCEACNGQRFKDEILEIKYNEKNIFDILELSVEAAIKFFESHKEVYKKLKPLNDVGLGYVKLGQSSNTLSGGEAQRVKLASFLGRERAKEHIFFIFDEPTTGLHFHDTLKLLYSLNALVEHGHTVLVVEHNMDIIKSADWLIDLGPEGGKSGGQLVYQGLPEGLMLVEASYTGFYLKGKLK